MFIFRFLGILAGIYSICIMIRFILSWFANAARGKFTDFLITITDPYLNWWRRNLPLKIGVIDLSAILGFAALSILQSILFAIADAKAISIGLILALVLNSVWRIIAFVIGFYIIVIALRLIAYFTSSNMYSAFWQIIDSISQPVLYRINRIFFKDRSNNFVTGIIVAIITLIVIRILGAFLVSFIAGILIRLPI